MFDYTVASNILAEQICHWNINCW